MQNNIVSSTSDQHAKTLSQESEKDVTSVLASLNDLGSGIATIMHTQTQAKDDLGDHRNTSDDNLTTQPLGPIRPDRCVHSFGAFPLTMPTVVTVRPPAQLLDIVGYSLNTVEYPLNTVGYPLNSVGYSKISKNLTQNLTQFLTKNLTQFFD